MKRYLFILLIVFGGFAAYIYITKPQPPVFLTAENISLSATGNNSYKLRYTLVFDNKNDLRTEVGNIKVNTTINQQSLIPIENELNYTLSSGEALRYPVEIRFTTADINDSVSVENYELHIDGSLSSNMLIGNYKSVFNFDK